MRTLSMVLVLVLFASIVSPLALVVGRAPGKPHINTIESITLGTSTYNDVFIEGYYSNQERTGNLGGVVYSSSRSAYFTAWRYVNTANYYQGPLYAKVIDATTHTTYSLTIESTEIVKAIDNIIAGDNSFAITYTHAENYGSNKVDTRAAIVYYDGSSYTVYKIDLGTNQWYDAYASGGFTNGYYLFTWYYSDTRDLYGLITNEQGSTVVSSFYITHTYLDRDDDRLGYLVVSGDNEWLIAYTYKESSGETLVSGRIADTTGSVSDYFTIYNPSGINATLFSVHGGAYVGGKYIVPFLVGGETYDQLYVAFISGTTTEDVVQITSGDASYPLLVGGSSKALLVWRDTSTDTAGDLKAVLIDPSTNSVSDIIELGGDVVDQYSDHHIFATYNPDQGYFVVAWTSSRDNDTSVDYVYVVTIDEDGHEGPITKVVPSALEGYDSTVHGIASGDNEVFIAVKHYPDSDSDTYLIVADLGDDVPEPYPTPPSPVNPTVWVYFTPDQGDDALNHIIDLINNANEYVYVATYRWYSDSVGNSIAQALSDAMSRGVDVKVAIDSSSSTTALDNYGIPYIKEESNAYSMHEKFFVIDDKYVVVLSANLGYYHFYENYNNIVILNDTRIAINYKYEFWEMYYGHTFHGGTNTTFREIVTTLNGSAGRIWCYFSPEEGYEAKNKLKYLISTANQSIYFLTYVFTDAGIANEIITAYSNGIEVRGIFESKLVYSDYSQYDKLLNAGIPVTIDKDSYQIYPLLHHKVFIIDGEYVYIGSANPTYSAYASNDENVLIIKNSLVAQKFIEEFNRLWSRFTIKVDVTVTHNGAAATGATVSVVDYGNGTDKTWTYTIDSTGTATIYLVHPYYHINLTDQDYTFTITYTGYPTVSKTLTLSTGDTDTLTINYIDVTLTATCPASGEVETPFTCTVTLSGTPQTPSTADVTIRINGTDWKTVTITGGSGSVDIVINQSGPATIDFIYNGGEEQVGTNEYNEYTSASDTATVNIALKTTSTTIVSVKPSTPNVGETITVTARVVFSNGTPVANALVKFIYNGTEHTSYTNSTGYATDTYTPTSPGTLTIQVVYDGVPGKYAGSTDSTTVTVGGAPPTTVETEITITGDTTGYIYESGTYTIELKYKSNGSTIPITASITIYVNGTPQTATLDNGVYTLTVDYTALGPLNITVVFPNTTIGSVTYLQSVDTLIVTVNKRPVNLTATVTVSWVNETHVSIEVSGEVKDARNGSYLSGTVRILVSKSGGPYKLVAEIPTTGTFSWSGVVDPDDVRVEFVPSDPNVASPGETGGGVVAQSLPPNPYVIPTPEPWILPVLLLIAIALIIMLRRR